MVMSHNMFQEPSWFLGIYACPILVLRDLCMSILVLRDLCMSNMVVDIAFLTTYVYIYDYLKKC
jgi:hypothetical protein